MHAWEGKLFPFEAAPACLSCLQPDPMFADLYVQCENTSPTKTLPKGGEQNMDQAVQFNKAAWFHLEKLLQNSFKSLKGHAVTRVELHNKWRRRGRL